MAPYSTINIWGASLRKRKASTIWRGQVSCSWDLIRSNWARSTHSIQQITIDLRSWPPLWCRVARARITRSCDEGLRIRIQAPTVPLPQSLAHNCRKLTAPIWGRGVRIIGATGSKRCLRRFMAQTQRSIIVDPVPGSFLPQQIRERHQRHIPMQLMVVAPVPTTFQTRISITAHFRATSTTWRVSIRRDDRQSRDPACSRSPGSFPSNDNRTRAGTCTEYLNCPTKATRKDRIQKSWAPQR